MSKSGCLGSYSLRCRCRSDTLGRAKYCLRKVEKPPLGSDKASSIQPQPILPSPTLYITYSACVVRAFIRVHVYGFPGACFFVHLYFSGIDVVGAETDENRVFALLVHVDQVRLLADLRNCFGIADSISGYDTIFRRVRFGKFGVARV